MKKIQTNLALQEITNHRLKEISQGIGISQNIIVQSLIDNFYTDTFQQQRDDFKRDNPVFNNYDLKLHYSMSGFYMTEEAYAYVENNKDDISQRNLD